MSDAIGRDLVRRLVLDAPFFGTLAAHLDWQADPHVETLQTNGVYVKYNPAYLASLTALEQLGVAAHEVLHPALLHPWRRDGRDLREWNEACDFAINGELRKSGFTLPAGILHDPRFDGMSAEQIYSKRRSQAQPPPPRAEPEPEPDPEEDEDPEDVEQPGDVNEADDESEDGATGDPTGAAAGGSMPGSPTGEFIDGPATAEAAGDLTAGDWETIAAEAAVVSERAGEMPGTLARAITCSREPRVDWKAELRDFIAATVETDYSWSRPNRRLLSRGLYLPGAVKENVGPIVVGVDISGSVTQDLLDQFSAELTALLRDAMPEKLIAVYCDTRVHAVNEFSPDEERVELRLPASGGGGTKFQPVFDWIEENDVDPLAVVYLTDLEGPAPELPRWPVLWTTPEWSRRPAPFGQLVRIA